MEEMEAAAERISNAGFWLLYTGNKTKTLTSVISSDQQNVEPQGETGGATQASRNHKQTPVSSNLEIHFYKASTKQAFKKKTHKHTTCVVLRVTSEWRKSPHGATLLSEGGVELVLLACRREEGGRETEGENGSILLFFLL